MLSDKQLAFIAIAGMLALLLMALAAGCADPFAVTAPTVTDNAETLAVKAENARLIAEIEKVKAQSGAEINRIMSQARQDLNAAAEQRDIELTALAERMKNENAAALEREREDIIPVQKSIWAIVSAAIVAVVYGYKRMRWDAIFVSVFGFSVLLGLVLSCKYYPQAVCFLPLPLLIIAGYTAYKMGWLEKANRAMAEAIETSGDKATKQLVHILDTDNAFEKSGRQYADGMKERAKPHEEQDDQQRRQ